MEQLWRDLDEFAAPVVDEPPALAAIRAANVAKRLPAIEVSPAQGRLLHLLALLMGAGRVLEVGTLGGYSTAWLALAAGPAGRVVTCELEPRHAEAARENLARAGLLERVDVLLGPAADTLLKLAADDTPPFDLVFIDADKPSTPTYLERALELTRPGAAIVIDNVTRHGRLIDPGPPAADVAGMRRALEMIADDDRLEATLVQTVGLKGWDGFALARVR